MAYAERAETRPQVRGRHPVAGHLFGSEKKHGDVQEVASLHLRIVPHVALLEGQAEVVEHGKDRLAHLVAEMTVGLAQQQEDAQGASTGRRRRVRRPAPRMTSTMASCTTRPVRSGWIPSHETSGKRTGRGAR